MNRATNIPVEVKRSGRLRCWLRRAFIGAVLLGGLCAAGFVLFSHLIVEAQSGSVGRADAIVVLTGGEARIPEAVRLLGEGKGRRLLISGVNPVTTRGELAALAPNGKKLFRCCIDVGHEARDTPGNADETRAWVEDRGFRSLIVVTASYHMPRSLAELRRALPDTRLIPYAVNPSNVHIDQWWAHRGTLKLLAIEYVKFVPAFLRCVGIQASLGRGVYGGSRQCLNTAASE
jgi:uncharacterized SAM-binding protein YcdF (DUF218 family)